MTLYVVSVSEPTPCNVSPSNTREIVPNNPSGDSKNKESLEETDEPCGIYLMKLISLNKTCPVLVGP